MSKILVTGGAGFIGAHTCRQLLDMGHEVTVVDFFHQYTFPMSSSFLNNMQYRFETLLDGAKVVRGNTQNKSGLGRQVAEARPEYIIHLAALPLANVALSETEEAFSGIVQGTVNLLEILRDMEPIKKFVYVSSSMIYGDFTEDPMSEEGEKNPKEIYGGMKLCGEILVKVFSDLYAIPYAIVRPSAVYGPTDNNRRVLQIFIENAMRGDPIIATDPENTFLDFTFVEDTAQGLAKVTLAEKAAGQAFNITYGKRRSLADAIKILKEEFPDLSVQTKAKEVYRPLRGALDVSRAKELAGYEPQYPLEIGLKKQIEFFREHTSPLADASN